MSGKTTAKNGKQNVTMMISMTFRSTVMERLNHQSVVSANGRFLRHRHKRSERCPNYQKLYQGQTASPNKEGAPKA
jgi:hypothetical protein